MMNTCAGHRLAVTSAMLMVGKDVISVGKMSRRGFTSDLTDRFRPFLSHPHLDYTSHGTSTRTLLHQGQKQ